MKEIPFNICKVELCNDCKGTGVIDESTIFRNNVVKCLTCNGTGRIKKTRKGVVTIEPYSA